MVVTKDPETGELRPATAASARSSSAASRSTAPEHKVVTLPDGSVMVELGEADMSYAVATRGSGRHDRPRAASTATDAAKKAALRPRHRRCPRPRRKTDR